MRVNKNNKKIFIIFALLCLFYFLGQGNAQYALKNSVFSNGAAMTSANANYNLQSNAGQTVIGNTGNNLFQANSGFFYSGWSVVTALDDFLEDLPITFALYQNYPNPFNPATTIKLALPKMVEVKIDVYNVLGQHMVTLLDESRPAGFHLINFNASHFSSGVYFYTIQAAEFWKVKKMMLVK